MSKCTITVSKYVRMSKYIGWVPSTREEINERVTTDTASWGYS